VKNSLLCWLLLVALSRVEAAELLIFTADWCGPCQQLKTDIAQNPEIMRDYEWGYVDFDAEKDLVRAYSVKTVPTFFILEGHNVVRQQSGYRGPGQLRRWLQSR
jgi:thioredoxin-like negative regulator of GroEL